ncbi:MAG: hypothetical protein WA138_15530 [Parvibaculum sp.]
MKKTKLNQRLLRMAVATMTVIIALSGCVAILGERFIHEPMHNPDTGEHVECGAVAKGLDASDEVIHATAKCVADHARKGFILDQQKQ